MRGFAWNVILLLTFLTSCKHAGQIRELQFELVTSSLSGINFVNRLEYSPDLNPYTFRNFYNGAGVALGDINHDGLVDIYFAGNLVDNALYLNKGNFQFEDITKQAGVTCANTWSTGVTMADVNGDGWLDIFVCKSGPNLGGIRHNELFINNHDLTFTESAQAWGVADNGLSLHTAFFDYDRDGDLDFYLLNNSNRSVGIYDLRTGQRENRDPLGGNKLYENTGSRFVDVTEAGGILASSIGYGLGIAISDVNVDGWPDIFVSNDFFEKDYLYINTGNRSFVESIEEYCAEISLGSMGADIADINNDGMPDVFVTDMLPETLADRKTKVSFEGYDKFVQNISQGYHRQFNRNVLHINQGKQPNSSNYFFAETGRYSGVSASNWSWGSLIADFDNDGLKDVFVASGIPQDLLDQDYINYIAPSIIESTDFRKDRNSIIKLIEAMPSTPSHNFMFKNTGDLKFEEVSAKAGLTEKGFSNGASYADLNNDGLLDLVISRINAEPLIYRNTTSLPGNFLKFNLTDSLGRTAIGAKVIAYSGYQVITTELFTNKGYCSSSSDELNMGLGAITTVDSLMVIWPDGHSVTKLSDIVVNKNYSLTNSGQRHPHSTRASTSVIFEETNSLPFSLKPIEPFIDFNRDRLISQNYSNSHPRMSVIDSNKDGLSDFFLFGDMASAPTLWLSGTDRYYQVTEPFQVLKGSEITDCAWADANNDGLLDMFVTCGGNRFQSGSYQNTDRLFINEGKRGFRESVEFVDDRKQSSSFVRTIDFTGDGVLDFIVGHSFKPFRYGELGGLLFLQNEANEELIDVSHKQNPEFSKMGHVTDLKTIDYDLDSDLDIVVCGHWMGLRLFENQNGIFKSVNSFEGNELVGLWNTVSILDADGDGRQDIVAGNLGLNVLLDNHGVGSSLVVGDLDGNGSLEQVLCEKRDERFYPMAMYSDFVKQLPASKKVANNFMTYSQKDLIELVGEKYFTSAQIYTVKELRSVVMYNTADGFLMRPLPVESQLSSIYSVKSLDVDDDSDLDIIVGGNNFVAKPEIGGQYALCRLLLRNESAMTFKADRAETSGLYLMDEIRGIELATTISGEILMLIGNKTVKTYKK